MGEQETTRITRSGTVNSGSNGHREATAEIPKAADAEADGQNSDPDGQSYCIVNCKHGRDGNIDEMIRCCLCYLWCHEDCVDIDPKYDTPSLWLCHGCRGTSSRILTLEQTVLTLVNKLEEFTMVSKELVSTNEQLAREIRKLNSEQQARLDIVNKTMHTHNPGTKGTVRPDLLIGSSILRDLVLNDDKDLVIKSHGGAKTNDILKMINNMKTGDYADITIHVGSNDWATKKPIPEIAENYDKIIEAAKRVSSTGHVTLSGICPRTDDNEAACRGKEFNARVQELVEVRGCVRVEHDGRFLCMNAEVNSALLLLDGLHLSEAGSKSLLQSLNLSSRAHVRLGRGIRAHTPPSGRPSAGPRHPPQHHHSRRDEQQPSQWNRDQRRQEPPVDRSSGYYPDRHQRGQRQPQYQQHMRDDTDNGHHEYYYRDKLYDAEKARRDDKSLSLQTRWTQRRPANHDMQQTRQPRCWYCNEHGHTYRQCRHGDYVECRNCGQHDHKSKHCESKRYDNYMH